jgi:hypothetical protein
MAILEGRWDDVSDSPARSSSACADNTPLALEGQVPGCGKSYSIRDHFRRHRRIAALLTVAPWNRLRCEMSEDGFKAVTLHKLLGRTVADDEDRKKAYDLAGITHIHFEEPYLYTVRELEWIRTFMRAHPSFGYTMAGDPGQLRPVSQKLALNDDEYYERIFAELFPHRLTLRYSKRCSTPEEGRRMEALCEDLRAELEGVPMILQRHGLSIVDFESLGVDDAKCPHLAATRDTVAAVNSWAHSLIEPDQPDAYLVGQQLLGRDGGKVKGDRLNPNEIYTVVSCDDKRLKVTNVDGKEFQPTLAQAAKLLQRPYCATNHAFQGLSLGNRIFIHEFDHRMADHRWMRTAVSRCSTLDIVLVQHRRAPRARAADVAARIESHRIADDRRDFAYNPSDYVNADWVATTLAEQRGQCAECLGDLGEAASGAWSIDRIDNDQPHTRGNCRLVCHVRKGTCQQKSGGRKVRQVGHTVD